MRLFAPLLSALPLALAGYAWVGYPLLLLVTRPRRDRPSPAEPPEWPFISITVPAYNEEAAIRRTLEAILGSDYPAERREIVVISDASTDRTDEIAREYEPDVRVLRLPVRRGKTVAENAAHRVARGDIIVNTDATVILERGSLTALIRAFTDPRVGVASGRDVSTGDRASETNWAESVYVGYEMGLRELETRAGSIVGASGCFYGFRRSLDDPDLPEYLSRDFANVLIARERGFRSVSVHDAVCFVPRAGAVTREYRRKMRTMARGLATLWYKRQLLNPVRFGGFAVMLASHKLCRWLVYPALALAMIGLAILAPIYALTAWAIAVAGVVSLVTVAGAYWPAGRRAPLAIFVPAYFVLSVAAGMGAWGEFLAGGRDPAWEPTRRSPD